MSVKEAIHESISCAIGLVRPLYEKIDPLEVGGHRRSLAIGEEYATRLLSLLKNPNCQEIVEKMVWKYPSHDFAVDYDEASEMGLPVKILERDQDIALVRTIRDLIRHEVPVYGFAPQARRQRKAQPPRVAGKRPTVQAAPTGPAGSRVA